MSLNTVNATGKNSTSQRDDRAPVESTENHATVLTTFDDLSAVAVDDPSTANITSAHTAADPYTDSKLVAVLSRMYPVATATWQIGDPIQTQIATLQFPSALMNTTITDRLIHYEYFRAGVELSIRINSTIFHKGLLQVAWLPHFNKTNAIANGYFDPFRSIYTESRLDNLVVSADTQDTVTFRIPYVAPNAYWDMATYPAETNGFFGYVSLRVLSPLSCGSNLTADVTLSIFARFVDPQVAGPIHVQSEDTDKDAPMLDDEAKSTQVTTEAQVRSQENTQASVATAKKPAKPSMWQHIVGKVIDGFIDFVPKAAIKLIPFFLDYPTSTNGIQPMQLRVGGNFSHTKGLDVSQILGTDPENKVATDLGMYCCPVDYNMFAHYKLLPTLLTNGTIATSQTVGTVVVSIPVNPMHVPTAGSGTIAVPYQFTPTHISSLAQLFRAWRGGLKYRFHFVASHFLSCRVRIEWIPVGTTANVVTNEMMGNNINKVVDINGDTVVDFVVPYLQPQHWLVVTDYAYHAQNPSVGSNGYIRMTIMNGLVSANTSTANDTIDTVIWVSGDDSFEIAYPHELGNALNGGTGTYAIQVQSRTAQSVYNMRDSFVRPFEGLIGCRTVTINGYENGETVHSFTEYCKRYTRMSSYSVSPGAPATGIPAVQPFEYLTEFVPQVQNKNFCMTNFMFQRGSFRTKLQHTSNIAPPVQIGVTSRAFNTDTVQDVTTLQTGLILQNVGLNPVLEFQVPYFRPWPFWNFEMFPSEVSTTDVGFVVLNYNGVSVNGNLYLALGDDYTWAWPLGFNILTYQGTT